MALHWWTLKRPIVRTLRIMAISLVALLVLLFVVIKIEMFRFRHRAEALISEMHQLRLYQSTWADAERLMTHWGAWGSYKGTCTAETCDYLIRLTDRDNPVYRLAATDAMNWLLQNKQDWFLGVLGDREPNFAATFAVRDGKIVRLTASASVIVIPWLPWSDQWPYGLIVQTKSRQRLHRTADDRWVMGDSDQLAQHPDYLAGRPGGCKICQAVVVTYATHTPPSEIEHLTTFHFACLTSLLPCTTLEDLLPAANGWRIYHDDETFALAEQHKSDPPIGCDIPLWAMARDQANVYLVDTLSTTTKKAWDGSSFEAANVKLLQALKGNFPTDAKEKAPASTVQVRPFSGDIQSLYPEKPEHLLPGHRYILLPDYEEDPAAPFDAKATTLPLPRCGVQLDTPEIRREVERGIALNDPFAAADRPQAVPW